MDPAKARAFRQALAGLLGASSLACQGPAPPPPSLLLVVIDNLRADHLGAYGYPRPTSPHLDALAQRGVLFTRAFAPSSWTRPSVASIFTSRLPSEHGAVSSVTGLDAGLPTLATALRAAGYETVGISGNFVNVSPATGLDRGFDRFEVLSFDAGEGDAVLDLDGGGGARIRLRAPTAEEVNARVAEEVARLHGERPFFLYVHYMEPHAGYAPARRDLVTVAGPEVAPDPGVTTAEIAAWVRSGEPPPPERVDRLVDLYDGEIVAVDRALHELLDGLETRGLADHTVVAVTSDHGEEFGEHGALFHGLNLHAESLAVPLLVVDPRRSSRGVRRDDPVDLLDVAPTLLAVLGVPVPPDMEGRPLLGEGSAGPRPLVAELHPDPPAESHLRERSQRLAVVRWPWKLIVDRDGSRRAYRLDVDPAESSPRAPGEAPGALRETAERLETRFAPAHAAPQRAPSEEERDRLRALGYAD